MAEKIWNTTTHYTKHQIDEGWNKLIENEVKTKLTSIEIIKLLKSDKECKSYLKFYTTIIEAMFKGEKVDYPEKEEFLILHKSLVEVYKSESN
ncbi:MAG: hypothetical protein ACWA5P_01725 [bacterium]